MTINAYYNDDQIVDDSLLKDDTYTFDDEQPLNEWFNYLLGIKNGRMDVENLFNTVQDMGLNRATSFKLEVGGGLDKENNYQIILDSGVNRDTWFKFITINSVTKGEKYNLLVDIGNENQDLYNFYLESSILKENNYASLFNFGVHSYMIYRKLDNDFIVDDSLLKEDNYLFNDEHSVGDFFDYIFKIDSKIIDNVKFATKIYGGLSKTQQYEILSWFGLEQYDFYKTLVLSACLNKKTTYKLTTIIGILKGDNYKLLVGTRLLGMLLFKGKEFRQDIDSGSI